MASGGLYSSIYITVHSPYLIIFVHWTRDTLEIRPEPDKRIKKKTNRKIYVAKLRRTCKPAEIIFYSLMIRLRSIDLKHLIPTPVYAVVKGQHKYVNRKKLSVYYSKTKKRDLHTYIESDFDMKSNIARKTCKILSDPTNIAFLDLFILLYSWDPNTEQS